MTANTWAVYDVTAAITGMGTYSFVITNGGSDPVAFRSREASGNHPYLEIETCPNLCLWLSQHTIDDLPTNGSIAYDHVSDAADRDTQNPDMTNNADNTDVLVLANALMYARTGTTAYRDDVIYTLDLITDAIPPDTSQPLAIARNTYAYVIAADMIDLPTVNSTLNITFTTWLSQLVDVKWKGPPAPPEGWTFADCQRIRPNNFNGHCAAARIAAGIYLNDSADVNLAADLFEEWLGKKPYVLSDWDWGTPESWHYTSNEADWVAINPVGTTGQPLFDSNCNPIAPIQVTIDGLLPDDMRRWENSNLFCEGEFVFPFPKDDYVYEALQGAMVVAELLRRYDSDLDPWQWQDKALKRAMDRLHTATQWVDSNGYTYFPAIGQGAGDPEMTRNDMFVPWLANWAYRNEAVPPSYNICIPPDGQGYGQGMSFTWWTHATTTTTCIDS